MSENEKWNFILALDDELLKGGVILSEWCSFIVREADIAFVNGANLAAILTATSAVETYLRSELNSDKKKIFTILFSNLIAVEKQNPRLIIYDYTEISGFTLNRRGKINHSLKILQNMNRNCWLWQSFLYA